jgi:hypothetical protein
MVDEILSLTEELLLLHIKISSWCSMVCGPDPSLAATSARILGQGLEVISSGGGRLVRLACLMECLQLEHIWLRLLSSRNQGVNIDISAFQNRPVPAREGEVGEAEAAGQTPLNGRHYTPKQTCGHTSIK